MKKIVLMMLAVFALSSCVKDVAPTSYENTKEKVLTDNFNTAFGVSEAQYANHRWGMNTIPLVDVTETASSRSMRGHNVNGNLWYQNWVRPTNVTLAEVNKVKAEFAKKREGQQATETIEWKNYWVQQVWKGDSAYVDGFGNPCGNGRGNTSGIASNCMNHLLAFNNLKENVISWWPYQAEFVTWEGQYEHINNFNNGDNTTVYVDDITKQQYVGTTLMVNMQTDEAHGSTQFGYHNTVDSKDHFEYVILEIDGSYYVGFDFYATHPEGQDANKNMDVERDWVFDDWIVKISPAKKIGDVPEVDYVRVMAEDLGTMSSDFDYNDVVFDVKFIKDGENYKADIILQAAGGTLPLYIGQGENNVYEVHTVFGKATDVMINTHAEDKGLKGVSGLQPKPITVNLPSGVDYSTLTSEAAVDSLNIRVQIGGNIVRLRTTKSNGLDGLEVSKAPKLIVAPVETEWADERDIISSKYSKFVDWITDETVEWWKN